MMLSIRFSIGVFLSCILAIPLLAQDDPRYDTNPVVQPSVPRGVETLTTPDGFDNFDLGIDGAEPHMSSNQLNPLWYFNAFNTNAAHFTFDGHDWTSSSPNFAAPMRGDPVTAYDSLGNLYYENMFGSPGIVGCKVMRARDNGLTWGPSLTAIDGRDKNWIACDQTMGPYANYVYTVMTAANPTGNFARSTDFGATWTNTWVFSTQVLPGMMVAVGPNVLGGNNISGGCVYVVTHSGSNSAGVYSFYRSTDGGVSFSLMSTQMLTGLIGTEIGGRSTVNGMRTRPYPMIAADNSFGPYRGRLYLVYATNDPAGNGNKADLFLHYSTDQGASWSARTRVNDDPNPQNNHQFFPAIWCEKQTGRLYIKWYDSRLVPTSDSMDVYATYTDNGGQTFAPNQRVSNTTFRTKLSGSGNPPAYQGDYDAITANPIGAMAVWTDFRNNTELSMTGYFPDFAMLASPPADTLGLTDSTTVYVKVPAVKLYTHSVQFTASVSPSSNMTVSFPQGNTLTSYPDSLPVKIMTNNTTQGVYAVTITGQGPNGTPVHRRDVTISAFGRFVSVLQPNGGEQIYATTQYPITWDDYLVDTVKIEYSTDGGSSWILIVDGVVSRPAPYINPKLKAKGIEPQGENLPGSYSWLVPPTLSSNCLVRITDRNNPSATDISNSPFSIIPPPAAQWSAKNSGTTNGLNAVSVVDSTIAWAAGNGGVVLRTLNGGATWLSRNVGTDVFAIHAIDASKALVVANASRNARILRTQTGGLAWATVYQDTNASAFLNGITMMDDLNGYAVGDPVNGQWTLLRTTDGGTTWSSAASLPQNLSEWGWVNSFDWQGQGGWFGTNNSRVYRTTNGGGTWSASTTPFVNSYAVSFASSQQGMASGDAVAFSSNGGSTWQSAPSTPPGVVGASTSLPLSPPRWYAASGSSVYRTDNQGATFSLDHSQANNYYHIDMKIVQLGNNEWITGYAVGQLGTITKYTELVTITDVPPTGKPEVYTLNQNYPNPFNPSTVITYGLPTPSHVTVKIMNILGQEIATLVNEFQDAGQFDVSWDGRNASGTALSTGVYFYRIDAVGSHGLRFTSMKKMLLVK